MQFCVEDCGYRNAEMLTNNNNNNTERKKETYMLFVFVFHVIHVFTFNEVPSCIADKHDNSSYIINQDEDQYYTGVR